MFKKKKYRIGKKQKRAILEVETGHEYMVFDQGKTEHVETFCKWLNGDYQLNLIQKLFGKHYLSLFIIIGIIIYWITK